MPKGSATPTDRVLLVEGPDDKHTVLNLCGVSSNMPRFSILDKEGKDNLLKSVRGEILAEGRVAVGIMLDANDDLKARWRSVAGRLRDAGVRPPSAPASNGTTIKGYPRVGVWLMPDNQSFGELEDFVERLIPSNDAVWPLSQTYIDQIPKPHREFPEGKTLKAKVHAWLATREHPRQMGSAIKVGDLDIEVEVSKRFVSWLRELFS